MDTINNICFSSVSSTTPTVTPVPPARLRGVRGTTSSTAVTGLGRSKVSLMPDLCLVSVGVGVALLLLC